jgi:outer membrane immunogenic protein
MLRKSHLASVAVAGIASLTLISGAHADGYEPAGKAMAAPVADYAWGGLYVGVGVGGAQFDNNVDVDGHKTRTRKKKCIKRTRCSDYGMWKPWGRNGGQKKTFGSASSGDDEWNVFGTLQVGYDHLMGKRFLVGVFADYDFFPQSDNSITTTLNNEYGKVGHVDGNLNLDGIWSVGGKLGFVVSPRWAIYGAGGYSEAKIRGSADVHFYGAPTVNLDLDDELQGWFLEGGTEVKVHRNVSFKFAYRYQEFDDSHASGSAYGRYRRVRRGCPSYYKCASKTDAWAKSDIETEIHSIRATLVIGLNPVPRAVVPLK